MFSYLKKFIDRGNSMANYDFCPWANKYFRWMKTPIGWVVMSAFCSLLIGLFVGPQGFVMFYTALAILCIGMSWPWLSMKRIKCRIRVDNRRVDEGEPLRVVLEVENRWPIPVFGLFIRGDFLMDESNADVDVDPQVLVALSKIPAWSRTEFSWEVSPDRRGKFPASQPEMVTGFPFGLYRSTKPIEIVNSAIVWPTVDFSEDISIENGVTRGITGTCSEFSGDDGETISVREYRPGDQIKSIHWSRTAQLNRLFVRDRQASAFSQVRVVVDLAHRCHSHSDSIVTYENSIRVAAALCRMFDRQRIPVELICIGLPEVPNVQMRGIKGLETALDELALLPRFSVSEEEPTLGKEVDVNPFSKANPNNVLIGTSSSMDRFGNVAGIQRICVDESGSIKLMESTSIEAHKHTGSRIPQLETGNDFYPQRAVAV